MLRSVIFWITLVLLASAIILSVIYGASTKWFNVLWSGLDRRVIVFILVVLTILITVLCVKSVDWLLRKSKIKIPPIYHWIAIGIIGVALLITQFNFIKQYNFYTGWDAGTVRHAAIEFLEGRGTSVAWFPEYFNLNSNNRTLTSAMIGSGRAADKMGVEFEEYNDVFIFVQLVVYLIASWALFVIARKLTGRFLYAWLAWVILLVLIGVSPWLSIPYSDCMSIAFSIVALWIFTLRARNLAMTVLKYASLGVVFVLAINMKPQSAIAVVAIVVYLMMNAIRQPMEYVTKYRTRIIAAIGGLIIMTALTTIAVNKINDRYVPIEKGYTMPWTHFMMMGLNAGCSGMYCLSDVYDVSLQKQFKHVDGMTIRDVRDRITTDEIKKINIAEIKRRLVEYGPVGLLNHFRNKLITNFNEGTFTWFGEGGFDWMIPDRRGQPGAWLRALYYNPERSEGFADRAYLYIDAPSHFQDFRNIERVAWWSTVLLVAAVGFIWRRKYDKDYIIVPAMLSVLGVVMFEMLFEARTRYFINAVPIFVLLAVAAISQLTSWRRRRTAKNEVQ